MCQKRGCSFSDIVKLGRGTSWQKNRCWKGRLSLLLLANRGPKVGPRIFPEPFWGYVRHRTDSILRGPIKSNQPRASPSYASLASPSLFFACRFCANQVFGSLSKEVAEMTTPPHILSVGKNPTLMSSRSLILRNAGYLVDEAYSVDKAINLVEADAIDAVLICHSVTRNEQQALISTARKKRRLMPVLCIRSYAYESAPQTCIPVDNEPEVLLNTVKMVTKPPTSH